MNTDNHKKIADALDQAAIETLESPLKEVYAILEEVEKACLQIENSQEVKRRLLELKVRIFCKKKAPFEKILPVYSELEEVGFSNFDLEFSMKYIFMRYCKDINNSLWEKIRYELKEGLKNSSSEFSSEAIERYEEILNIE